MENKLSDREQRLVALGKTISELAQMQTQVSVVGSPLELGPDHGELTGRDSPLRACQQRRLDARQSENLSQLTLRQGGVRLASQPVSPPSSNKPRRADCPSPRWSGSESGTSEGLEDGPMGTTC